VLGDVGDPQAVGFVASETPIDAIDGGDALAWPAEAFAGRQAGEALVAHDPGDQVVPHDDPAAQTQLGVHPWRPVDAS
jgi:hypothetical protein